MKKIFFICMLANLLCISRVWAATGDTSVCKWKDNKTGAFSLGFDDSLPSHANFVIPRLLAHGFNGSFWINPGGWRFESERSTWEASPQNDMDLCNHSMNHTGAANFTEAEYEVGECSRIIWSIRPAAQSKLTLFLRGGGSTWNVSDPEWQTLYQNYFLLPGRGAWDYNLSIKETETYNTAITETVLSYAVRSVNEGVWVVLHFHGVGPNAEWLICPGDVFDDLLNYLDTVTDQVWIDNCLNVHKYRKEREGSSILVNEATSSLIRLDLTSTANFNGDITQFDYPLTLRTEVPSGWTSCRVTRDGDSTEYTVTSGVVQYDVLPNKGEITLEDPSAAPPVKKEEPFTDPFADVKIYPNPVIQSQNANVVFKNLKTGTDLKIYTLDGRLIAKLNEVNYGEGEIIWDSRNEKEELIVQGLYIYVLVDGAGNKKTGKLTIVR